MQLGLPGDYKVIMLKHIGKISIKASSAKQPGCRGVGIFFGIDGVVLHSEVLVEEFAKAREEQRLSYNENLVKAYNKELSQLGKKSRQISARSLISSSTKA